jgi:ATP-binding cassette subfamily B protein
VDRIVMLNQGRVVEQGSCEALLAKRGAYWRFTQSDGEWTEPDPAQGVAWSPISE